MENIIITRIFNAPKEKVWKAWTKPEQIKKWWGPKGFSAPIIKLDLRKDGNYLYSMKDSSGKMYWSGGKFKEIDTLNYLKITDYFSDEKGNIMDPKDYGMDPNFPKESEVTIKFEDENNKTKLSIIYIPESAEAREAMEKSKMDEGWNSSLDKLQELVEDKYDT